MTIDSLLTPGQIAEKLGVKVSTIYQWTHQSMIPHVKLGRFVRFRAADINKWLDSKAKAGRTTRSIDLSELGL